MKPNKKKYTEKNVIISENNLHFKKIFNDKISCTLRNEFLKECILKESLNWTKLDLNHKHSTNS